MDDLQDNGSPERLDGFAAHGQVFIVLLVDRIPDLIDAARVINFHFLGPLAGGFAEGQPLGDLPDGGGLARLGQLKLDESYVVINGLSEGEEVVTSGTFSVDAAAQLEGKPSMMNPAGQRSHHNHQH